MTFELDGSSLEELGRALGHDLYALSRLPLNATWDAPLREGFLAAQAQGRPRHSGDRFQRKWLQLRLGAWQRGRAVAADVRPERLRELDLSHCPVTRELLSHGLQQGSDASIDRLNNEGAYALSNLAVMSVRANRAKGSRSFAEVLALAQGREPRDGQDLTLSQAEWARLAALMLGPCFAVHPLAAPALPLTAPLPVHAVRTALQQIQRLLTLQTRRPADKNALFKALKPACHNERALQRWRLLVDAAHQGLKLLGPDEPCWDLWLQAPLMPALLQWQEALDDIGWAKAAYLAGQVAGGRRVTASSLQPWQLPSRGYWPAALQLRS